MYVYKRLFSTEARLAISTRISEADLKIYLSVIESFQLHS